MCTFVIPENKCFNPRKNEKLKQIIIILLTSLFLRCLDTIRHRSYAPCNNNKDIPSFYISLLNLKLMTENNGVGTKTRNLNVHIDAVYRF